MQIEVSAGIIRRADGRILVCQRGEGRKNAHLWEFPGGKREAGESFEDCLVRELREELSLPVTNVRRMTENTAQGIRFVFLTCETDAQPVPTEHEAVRFVRPREMLDLPFCPADTEVAARLALNDPPLKHFFWDFDGTLMDSYPAIAAALVRAGARLGLNLRRDELLPLFRDCLNHAIETVAGHAGMDPHVLRAAYDEEYKRPESSSAVPMPGIRQALEKMQQAGGKHYLVTHRDGSCLDMLARCGLRVYFSDHVTGDMGFPRKPAPDGCLYLLKKHGIDPAEAVMIGDRPLDTRAGQAAGMLGCLLGDDGLFADEKCELRADDAWRLPGLLLGTDDAAPV